MPVHKFKKTTKITDTLNNISPIQQKLEKHSITVHNSRRPLNHLTLTFDLIFIDGRGIVMDYPCAKFGDFSFSRFDFIVRTDRQNHIHTHWDDCYTHATPVGVSDNNFDILYLYLRSMKIRQLTYNNFCNMLSS